MNDYVNKRVDELADELVESTQKMVRIKSVEAEAEEGKPFGPGVNDALETFLNIAEGLGLDAKNVDGYAGHVEIGQGDDLIGVLCHLDVVPEGKNWLYPPYAAEIHDDKIYGRGTIDDKGPAVAALYALKAVKDSGLDLQKRVRLIVGTNEESGWKGLNYYFKKEEKPAIGFSPDAEFPVIHAEKGILNFNLKSTFKDSNEDYFIKSIEGGNAPNMVPDYCEAVLANKDLADLQGKLKDFLEETKYNIELVIEEDKAILKSHGVSAHGSTPEKGQNAISQLMLFLNRLDLAGEIGDFIKFYNEKIGMEYNGQSLSCDLSDEVSGRLVFNVGKIKVDSEEGKLVVNIRYPVTLTKDDVYQGIRKEIAGMNVILEEVSNSKPLYVPKDDPLVTKLMKVYQEFTGDKSEPIAIGGGTYARALDKAVAFGALFPGQPELAHQKDEYIVIKDLIMNAKIYANAIIELAKK